MDIKCTKRTEQKIAFIKRNLHQDYIIDAGVIELILQHSNWINIRNALVPITFFFSFSLRARFQFCAHCGTHSRIHYHLTHFTFLLWRTGFFTSSISLLLWLLLYSYVFCFFIRVLKSIATMLQMTRSSRFSLQTTWNIIFIHRQDHTRNRNETRCKFFSRFDPKIYGKKILWTLTYNVQYNQDMIYTVLKK